MVLRFALVLLFLAFVRTSEDSYELALVKDFGDWNVGFSQWLLTPDDFKVMKISKRDTQGQAEGGVIPSEKVIPAPTSVPASTFSSTLVPVKPAPVDTPKHPTAATPDASKGKFYFVLINFVQLPMRCCFLGDTCVIPIRECCGT